MALLDLRRTFLQVRVHEFLWVYQTILIKRERHCLIWSGFGLNMVPMIMKAIISTVLPQEEQMMKVTSSYIDDIYVNEDIVSADEVKTRLESFGLTCKDPERLKHGAKLLVLKV